MAWLPGEVTYYDGKTSAPGVTDDINSGYEISDLWIDETNDEVYECLDNAAGAAVWEKLSSAGEATADIATHAALTTGVHGAGASTIATTGNISTHAALITGVHGLVITASKTFTLTNSLTFSGTDASTLNIGTGGTLGTAAYTAATAYATVAQTFYIGTTQVAINRASAALTLAGITLTTPDIGTPSAGVLTNCSGLPVAGGGTGAATFALNGILYGNNTSAIGVTAIGAAGQILRAGASPFVPAWTTSTFADTYAIGTILHAGAANVITGLAAGAEGTLLMGNGAAAPSWLAAGTAGYFLLANGAADPVWTSQPTLASLESLTIAAGTLIYGTAADTLAALAAGATTTILVGGGAAAPVWTTATGTGAPVRAGSPTFTTQITTPLIYGGAAENDDVTIAGTSHATKTTSYVILQPTGGNVGIGTTNPTNILSFGNTANRKIWIENSAADVAGKTLTIAAGSTIVGSAVPNVNGGDLILQAGLNTGNLGTSNIIFQTAQSAGAGATLTTMATRMTINNQGNVGIGTAGPDMRFHVEENNAATNSAIAVQRLSLTSTGTPAAGLGPQLQFEVETAAGVPGNQEVVAAIDGIVTDVTSTAEIGALVFKTMKAGAVVSETARITSNLSINSPTENGNLVGGLVMKTGTASSAGVTDGFQLYSADIVVGNAAPHFYTEAGNIIKLYTVAEIIDELTTMTSVGPGTPDYAIQAAVEGTGFGYATADEFETVQTVIINNQARINALEVALVSLGLLADAD